MSSNNSLSKIPISVVGPKLNYRLHWQRRVVQASAIIIAVLIPMSGLFRIDPIAGAFVVLDRQIWWSDFFLVFGLWMLLASGLVMMYSFVGTAFCGWGCPQNSLSEWANLVTRKLLGKRAEVSVDGTKMNVAASKNTWTHWAILGLSFLLVAMGFALIPLFYFYSPKVVWDFVTFNPNEQLASSLHYIYTIFVLVIFLDIAFIRHFFCRFMCIYKVWQHGFKTRQTLHVAYDATRSDECAKCNYCVTACFLDIDPTKTDIYDSCINCGECITACNNLHAKKGTTGLLKFEVGERNSKFLSLFRSSLGSLSSRLSWTVPFSLLGLGMFIWGAWHYEHFHLAVYRADSMHETSIEDYRISIANKIYKPASLSVSVEGLPQQSYILSDTKAIFDTVGRIDLNLHIKPGLSEGLHSLFVRVKSDDGWEDSFRVQHFEHRG